MMDGSIEWIFTETRKHWKDYRHVVFTSLATKIFLLSVCYLFNSPVYDKNADQILFDFKYNKAGYPWLTNFSFLLNWDGWYFYNTTTENYSNLQQSAFYPGFPSFVHLLDKILQILPGLSSFLSKNDLDNAHLMLIGFLLNFTLHLASTILIMLFGKSRGLSHNYILRIGYLFALNPTALFHVTYYSESLHIFITLVSLISIQHNLLIKRSSLSCMSWSSFLVLSLFFASSGIVRSLGLLNYAYIGYPLLVELFKVWQSKQGIFSRNSILICLKIVIAAIFFILPTAFLFIYNRKLYCSQPSFDNQFEIPDFCQSSFGFFYGYIQEKYWNVKFLGQLREGNYLVYVLSINSIIIIGHYLLTTIRTWGIFNICTMMYIPLTSPSSIPEIKNAEKEENSVKASARTLMEFPDLVITCIVSRTFYFYAHQNSIERFVNVMPSYLLAAAQHPLISTLNIAWRLLVTPLLFVTNIHPI